MRHDGDAARVMNQTDRIRSRHFEFWHPCWPVLLQESLESFVKAAAEPSLDQGSRNVRTARRPAVRQRKNSIGCQWNLYSVQSGNNFPNPILADVLKLRRLLQQPWILRIEIVAEDMKF